MYLKENVKRIQRRLTNLIILQCENWICSEDFYVKNIKGNEIYFANAFYFSQRNANERKLFDLNIFTKGFRSKFIKWNIEKIGNQFP